MAKYRIISSDSHVIEPADLWTSRIDPQFRERAPYTVREESTDQWYVEKNLKFSLVGIISQAGARFEAPDTIRLEGRIDDVRPGSHDLLERFKDLEVDGVYGETVYPSHGLGLFRLGDSALFSATCRAYNDWLAELCKPFPNRVKGIAMVNLDDVPEGIKELERAAKMGLAGAMISVYPLAGRQYDQPEYSDFWAAAQDLGMPLSFHSFTQRPSAGPDMGPLDPLAAQRNPSRSVRDYVVRLTLGDIIMSGVFERYPLLKIVVAEFELGWAPHFLWMLDYDYVERKQLTPYRFKDDAVPSDLFRSNVYLSFQEDALGIQCRNILGVDNLMWGSDYPHAESTWPRSQQFLEDLLADCTEEEKAKIAGGNAARLYGFN